MGTGTILIPETLDYERAEGLAFDHVEETGMEYELYEDREGQLWMAASHDGVGLITWFRMRDEEEFWQVVELERRLAAPEDFEEVELDESLELDGEDFEV